MDPLKLYQATNLVLTDRLCVKTNGPADGVIFHARSFNGDDYGLFDLASDLTSTVSEKNVMVNGGDGVGHDGVSRAWPGYEHYKRCLARNPGVNVVAAKAATNTLEEGFVFSEKAHELGWKQVVVIAQPFQLLRIMLTHVHVMHERGYYMRVYPVAPNSVNWLAITSANQGAASVSRFDQIGMELERVEKYQAAGSLASFDKLVEYMTRWRKHID